VEKETLDQYHKNVDAILWDLWRGTNQRSFENYNYLNTKGVPQDRIQELTHSAKKNNCTAQEKGLFSKKI